MTSLCQDKIAEYEREGFLVVRELFSDDLIDRVIEDAERLAADTNIIKEGNLRCRRRPHLRTGEFLLDALEPITDLAPAIKEVAEHPGMLDVLTSLLGEPVCLLKDKLIYKPASTHGLPLHQDYISWPDFPKTCTLVLVAVDLSIRENGCIEVFPGAHKAGYLSPRDGRFHSLDAAKLDGLPSQLVELYPGDAIFFHCLLPHRSGPNLSDEARRHLYFGYNALSDGGDQREHHYDRHFTWQWKELKQSQGLKFFR
ncbi:MAG: phytanoyl-CoA dioxygenase family protein [Acidobacteriota bacterium]|nr:phytanoyl-CoA dioxygenase family protein [Acidobacteriota bacterium]